MLVIIYIIRLLAPIVNTLGIIGLLTYGMYVCDYMIYFEDPSTYITENPTTKVIGTIGYANGMTFLYLSIGNKSVKLLISLLTSIKSSILVI